MRTPMERLKDWVKASVFDISREKISEAAIEVKGVSGPRLWAMAVERRADKQTDCGNGGRRHLREAGSWEGSGDGTGSVR